jgi:hypothetical protein
MKEAFPLWQLKLNLRKQIINGYPQESADRG